MGVDGVKKAVRDRVLNDLLGTVVDGSWKVLVLDELTTQVVSSSLKMSDIQESGVSTVEDLRKAREPLPLPAVYFIQPTLESVELLIRDFKGTPLYPSAHVFFSSRATKEDIEKIKGCPALTQRLKALKETNLEFLTVDSRTVVTGHRQALPILMGEKCEVEKAQYDREIESITGRLATLFATMNDFPSIRYKIGKPPEPGDPAGQSARSLLTQRIAAKLTERVMVMQRADTLPNKETCDLLIMDRSFDPVAPFIHEWTYEAMVHDLLETKGDLGNIVSYASEGRVENRESVLEEFDELWLELRHSFIADAYNTLHDRLEKFQSKNKAAKLSSGNTKEMSSGNIKALIQALPQFRDFLSRLSLHLALSSSINVAIDHRDLREIGGLEQDLVYGDKSSRDLITFLGEHTKNMELQDKIRLFLCYLATHPDKMDSTKKNQWMKVFDLSPADMNAVCSLAFLGVSVMKPSTGGKGLTFGGGKKKKAVRKAREGPEAAETYVLSRFDPLLLEVVEDLAAAKLPAEEYPYVKAPQREDSLTNDAVRVASARTNRSRYDWASGASATSSSGGSIVSGGPPAVQKGRRLYVFIAGGATYGEMRVIHQVSRNRARDIILVSTTIDPPSKFVDHMRKLSNEDVVAG